MKVAIIIGGANCVWSDYELAKVLVDTAEIEIEHIEDETFVTNDSISLFPDRIDNAVTLHPDKLSKWAHERNAKGLNIPPRVWAHRTSKLVTNITSDWGGSSGLFACKIAIELGYTKIILCGVPMDAGYNHIVRNTAWNACNAFWRGWETRHNEIYGKVKSFTGRTAQKLGLPTLEWLRSEFSFCPAPRAIGLAG